MLLLNNQSYIIQCDFSVHRCLELNSSIKYIYNSSQSVFAAPKWWNIYSTQIDSFCPKFKCMMTISWFFLGRERLCGCEIYSKTKHHRWTAGKRWAESGNRSLPSPSDPLEERRCPGQGRQNHHNQTRAWNQVRHSPWPWSWPSTL